MKRRLFCLAVLGLVLDPLRAEICNLKVVTDASPDYSDMPSLVHSITSKWKTPEEKCWALFYWNHIARRQTSPMLLHGLELTDPIRQFNDYGYTMCSTISGINCAIWHNMGLKARFWDISLHTVPEVFYDGRWHMYDNSMSALYTLCDGRTLAGVEDIGQTGACELSGGRAEPGHIARYHCLSGTGPNGFLTGADTQRSLDEEAHCFNTNALKYRSYYFNWDYGHRYILNLRQNEAYTRHYSSLGASPEFFVPNNGKDPDDRYHLRGNGQWDFHPDLKDPHGRKAAFSSRNVAWSEKGIAATSTGEPGEILFKVEGANVMTSEEIKGALAFAGQGGEARVAISTDNGLHWKEVWSKTKAGAGAEAIEIKLLDEVNGDYELLIKLSLRPGHSPEDLVLSDFQVQTTTMLNAKTQPRLNLGRNTVFIGCGAQTEAIVFWPELQDGKYKKEVVEEKNIASVRDHPGYQGVIYPSKPKEDAWLVYRIDAPREIKQVTFGGRFYNRAPKSHVDLLYSFDAGQTWTKAWSLRRTSPPWDVIHYETFDVPGAHRSVWLKYLLNSTEASPSGCGIYALRIEADHLPADDSAMPLAVTFNWSERSPDRSLVERSHTQLIDHLPFKYQIDVGGADHPVVNWLRVSAVQAGAPLPQGYSDRKDPGGEKFIPRWLKTGGNLAIGKPYKLSKPSATNWGAGDDGKKLTSGAGGPSYAGGTSYKSGALWLEHANPEITVDLGTAVPCAAFGMNFHGYPWWDALKGEVKDKVEVLTSTDGTSFSSQGFLKTDLRWVDLPVNFMWPDDETITSDTFRCIPNQPVNARFVRYKVENERIFDCAGLEVLDSITLDPHDLGLALPDEAGPGISLAPPDDGS